jgi:hypothetical protein
MLSGAGMSSENIQSLLEQLKNNNDPGIKGQI